MTVTATAKRRRRQARMLDGRKIDRIDFKRKMMAKARERRKL